MIGDFVFGAAADQDVVRLEIFLIENAPYGLVHVPDTVAELMESVGLTVSNEAMRLSIALGLGVTVAAESGVSLRVMGEIEAWPAAWGELKIEH